METQSSVTNGQSAQTSTANSSTSGTTLKVEAVTSSTAPQPIVEAGLQAPDPIPVGYQAVQDFLGMASADESQKEKMQYIYDHYAKGRDRSEAIEAIADAKRRLSPPDIGETYLHKLYAYTRLEAESRSIEREKKAFEQ